MITLATGNLFDAPTEAVVNAVNTVGVMGKGLALQFKQAYPKMFVAYAQACALGEVKLGRMHVYDLGLANTAPRWIINFPTKGHWRSGSRLADVEAGLFDLREVVRSRLIRSLAIPALGCGLGGLNWRDVQPRIEAAFSYLPDVNVVLYPPIG